jgi:hypothetical protein
MARADAAGIGFQIGSYLMGRGITLTAQRHTAFLKLSGCHILTNKFAHGFPAVNKPGLPIPAVLIFTVFGVSDPGAGQTGTFM